MNNFISEFEKLEKHLASERGPFLLYALVKRNDSQGRWDLVVSAYWLETEKREARRYITETVSEKLSPLSFDKLSRVIWLAPNSEAWRAFFEAKQTDRPALVLNESGAFGFLIEDVHIFTAQDADLEYLSAHNL